MVLQHLQVEDHLFGPDRRDRSTTDDRARESTNQCPAKIVPISLSAKTKPKTSFPQTLSFRVGNLPYYFIAETADVFLLFDVHLDKIGDGGSDLDKVVNVDAFDRDELDFLPL
jgi:hypothetical protein